MDINQISIKNNQIKTVDIEKNSPLTPGEPSAISFRQILADCKAGSNGKSDSAAQEQTESSVDQEDPLMIKEDDWQVLESMLSTLFATLQQGQTMPVPEAKLPAENTYGAESLPISSSLQQFDEKLKQNPIQFTNEISSVLAKFLEGQPLTAEQSQLISQIGDVLIKSQEKQENQTNQTNQTNQVIGEVPQQIIDKLKEAWGTKVEQKKSSEPLLPISLDKDLILQSSMPKVVRIGNQSNARDASSGKEDVNKELETSAVLNQQTVPISQNLIQDKPPESPLLVSRFVPEVSEWMDRFMKVTNGQSGDTEAVLSLFPEHLGEIEIKISSQQGQVSAQILTDTMAAKKVLEGQLQNLHQALQQHGLQVQKLDIIQQVPSANLNQTNLSFSQSGSGYQQGQQRTFTRDGDAAKPQRENEIEGEVQPVTYGRTSLRSASNIDFTA
ncbi:flagellar hook-length control protein FliK [Bacillus sp. ISL-18]|uniref:flagellar hook-length control protein FliK n=1 Tax=Bacillus sp. ISL-18 TaxID=2819118 RepID=UPI001BEB6314|nr:flagellar hook-length control protein FliK [Bacillus sp. ISL-18]MBT2657793.1 flagellar hook-length control protein FliK [Bacillus sp. ISL-18]